MRDQWFIRGNVPMTKAEVRAVSLSKLELSASSVLLDIGSGTGSVSVEALLCSPVKKVYAFEKNEEAAKLLDKNREKAGLSSQQLCLIKGIVPESLPAAFEILPTHGFIGGSSGKLKETVKALLKINPAMRIVINVIALESLAAVTEYLKENQIDGEIVCLQVSKAVKAGSCHLMQGQNPVYVISFGGKNEY